jgi:mycothiol S-conjugate amidase
MCHTVAMSAFEAAGDPERYPHAGEPWQPLKVYYNGGWSKDRLTAIHEAMVAEGLESPYAEWLGNWKPRRAGGVTTRVECADFFETRDRALLAHATQVDPDGFWFQVPSEIQKRVWPVEEFELAVSYVPVELPETDLFAGIASLAEADELAQTSGIAIVHDGRLAPDDVEKVDPAEKVEQPEGEEN